MKGRNHVDQEHIWHPYSAMHSDLPVFEVDSAAGVRLKLKDGRELIDGMASWWCVIHGYNHPAINAALEQQIGKMSHVMFGGLTHQPAITLTQLLIKISPDGLDKVFYSDSGSVAVEVAMKMAIQYWFAKGQTDKKRFIALRSAYHGDTFAAMSVCDPDTGMHGLFNGVMPEQYFVSQPSCRFGEACNEKYIHELEKLLIDNRNNIAAMILEPIVQGAGGMWFYSAEYLKSARELCTQYGVLLIADEIATGFGRSGKLFACEHANILPDIMCIGKSLTGGYMSLAATITTEMVANTIDNAEPGVFMHGPTFMANPLACSAAIASIKLLLESNWQDTISQISMQLMAGLEQCRSLQSVNDVRVLGAIGVVEMNSPINMKIISQAFVDEGVWIRPFGKLIYLMPPYIINHSDLSRLTTSVYTVINKHIEP